VAFSAPTTSAESQRPEEIYEKAETTAFAPELQRLSILCEIFGFIPSNSHKILELYCSSEHVDNNTASISFLDNLLFFKMSMQGLHANSNIDEFEFFINSAVAYDEIATLRTLKC
jgi:hypothetical protein